MIKRLNWNIETLVLMLLSVILLISSFQIAYENNNWLRIPFYMLFSALAFYIWLEKSTLIIKYQENSLYIFYTTLKLRFPIIVNVKKEIPVKNIIEISYNNLNGARRRRLSWCFFYVKFLASENELFSKKDNSYCAKQIIKDNPGMQIRKITVQASGDQEDIISVIEKIGNDYSEIEINILSKKDFIKSKVYWIILGSIIILCYILIIMQKYF